MVPRCCCDAVPACQAHLLDRKTPFSALPSPRAKAHFEIYRTQGLLLFFDAVLHEPCPFPGCATQACQWSYSNTGTAHLLWRCSTRHVQTNRAGRGCFWSSRSSFGGSRPFPLGRFCENLRESSNLCRIARCFESYFRHQEREKNFDNPHPPKFAQKKRVPKRCHQMRGIKLPLHPLALLQNKVIFTDNLAYKPENMAHEPPLSCHVNRFYWG